ncbi:MAG: MucR family transcriptional regulator [Alphaproteobacteria bacterium]|nr:MucR family transcriptional regulator [Alphaproteobacteria bacterium]
MMRDVARIVAAYVANHRVAVGELPGIIREAHAALAHLGEVAAVEEERIPAVPVKKSIRRDTLVCLECGKPQKTLKRHLASAHGLSADGYRARWDLGADYPMVAPDYAELRSTLAKKIGLGTKPEKKAAPPAPESPKRSHHYPANRWAKPSGT